MKWTNLYQWFASLEEKSNSAKEIKNVELQRAVHILEKNVDSMVQRDVGPHNLVLTKATSLSEDLTGEDFFDVVDNADPPFCEAKQTRGQKKKTTIIQLFVGALGWKNKSKRRSNARSQRFVLE